MSVSFVSFRIARILSRESACRILSSCTCREPNRHCHQQGGQLRAGPEQPQGTQHQQGLKECEVWRSTSSICAQGWEEGRHEAMNPQFLGGSSHHQHSVFCLMSSHHHWAGKVEICKVNLPQKNIKEQPNTCLGASQDHSKMLLEQTSHFQAHSLPCCYLLSAEKGPSRTVVKSTQREHNWFLSYSNLHILCNRIWPFSHKSPTSI